MQLREFLLGIEGLALLRGMAWGTDQAARQRIDEIGEIVANDDFRETIDRPIFDVSDGYERWASTYDEPGNPLIAAEQPVLWQLLEGAGPGRALDVPCGTGRHTERLIELGHEVIAVDRTPAMLSRARERAPHAHFIEADLRELPLEDDAVDLAICALALEHLKDLEKPVAELARVVRRGGRVIISESHPTLRSIGGAPFFRDASGGRGVIRSHNHLHGDYLAAFQTAGIEVRRCIDVLFEPEQVAMQEPAATLFSQATAAAMLGLPAVLIWDLTVGAKRSPD